MFVLVVACLGCGFGSGAATIIKASASLRLEQRKTQTGKVLNRLGFRDEIIKWS